MKLTFIPAPGSPCRVLEADDPQPEESWSPQATNIRIAPAAAPRPQPDVPAPPFDPPARALPAAPEPDSSASEPPSDSSPACTDVPDFLEPLPPGSCRDCPDRPLL